MRSALVRFSCTRIAAPSENPRTLCKEQFVKTSRLAIAVLALSGAALAFGQTDGIAEFKGSVHSRKDQVIPSKGKVYFSKGAVRVEWVTDLSQVVKERKDADKTAIPDNFQMVMIQRVSEPDRMISINDKTKTYSVTAIDRDAEKLKRPERKWKVERKGRDTVAGFACEKAVLTAEGGDLTEVCVVTDWIPSTAWLAAWNRREEQASPLKALKEAGLTGFPVRWIFRHKAEEEAWSSVELVHFSKQSVPASMFEIPAGYRKVDSIMETMSLTPEQQEQLREARKKMQEALDRMTPEQRKQYEEMMRQRTPAPNKP
jgi:hypothetical protein